MPRMDLLCGESTFRDVAFYRTDEEPTAGYGYFGEEVDGEKVG